VVTYDVNQFLCFANFKQTSRCRIETKVRYFRKGPWMTFQHSERDIIRFHQ